MAFIVPKGCSLCPRLCEFRAKNKALYPNYYNAPVNAFAPSDGEVELLIVGLAPGLHGANQTGRPFTGDYAGELLYKTLKKFAFLKGEYKARIDDGVQLQNCAIVNVVRCVPPENKPIGAEINQCLSFLQKEIAYFQPQIILALGQIAHKGTLKALGLKQAEAKFSHGALHYLRDGLTLIDSYHCSRYNTNTGRLTTKMFEAVFKKITEELIK